MGKANKNTTIDGFLSAFLKKKRFEAVLPFIPSGSAVLDIGCNDGSLIDFLSKFSIYLGVDCREDIINVNLRRNNPPNVIFKCCDFNSIEWDGPLFDVIVMTAVLEHLENPVKAFERIDSLLKDTGFILLTTPCPQSHLILKIGGFFGLFAKDSCKDHKKYFSKPDFELMAGWEVVVYKKFEFCLNQLVVMKKQERH